MYNELTNFLIKSIDSTKGDEFKQDKLASTSKTTLNNPDDITITTYSTTVLDTKKNFSQTYEKDAQLPNQKAIN